MLKKLKSIFIVEDEAFVANETGGKKTAKEATESTPANKSKNYSPQIDKSKLKSSPKSSSKFVDVLLKAIDANNLEGFDYLEYKQALQNLTKMSMDEATRYKSAYAMAQTMGVSPKKLMDSASHYLNVLSQEDSKFKEALSNQKKKQVEDKQARIKQLENLIVEKQKKIESIKAEVVKHKKQLEDTKSTIHGAAEKIELTRINFETAYNSVGGQIKEDIEKMKQYLK